MCADFIAKSEPQQRHKEWQLSWDREWRPISARLASLLEAGKLPISAAQVTTEDSYGSIEVLRGEAVEIYRLLRKFHDSCGSQLPEVAASRLSSFLEQRKVLFEAAPSSAGDRFQRAKASLTVLAVFRAEFSYLAADLEVRARSLVDRAFAHLQRSIVADEEIRTKWQRAFAQNETACEKLGAVHLLLHGIWAFKVDAAGERTDLVLGQHLVMTEIESTAEALVLTEWKRAMDPKDLEEKARQAYEQARKYSSGSLAGVELSSRRYLILVSKDWSEVPGPTTEGVTVYEYRNIAVEPSTPSRFAQSAH